MELKDRIRELRIKANLTQTQLAQETGISQVSIKSYEAGRRQPNSKAMVILENYFDVSGAYLRGETDFMKWDNPVINNAINDNLPIAANSLISSARNGTEKTTSLLFDMLVELRSLINTEQKLQTDAHSDFVSRVLLETTNYVQKVLSNEEHTEKWNKICGESTLNIIRYFMEFQDELLEKKDIKNR